MFYRIKFRACPTEYVFEMGKVNYEVLVKDVLPILRDTFKIMHDNLILYDVNYILKLTDKIQNARTYIIRRVPR